MPKGDEVMEVRKLKTAIAGCGKIFPMHAVPVSRDPHAVLTAVCDMKPERAGAAAERFGWRMISCAAGQNPKTVEEIHKEVLSVVEDALRGRCGEN